jgi:hypothetical protein
MRFVSGRRVTNVFCEEIHAFTVGLTTTPFSAIHMAGPNSMEKGSRPKRSCNACTPAM